VVQSVESVMSVPTTLLIPTAARFLVQMAANRNMLIMSASSCASVLVVISGTTVLVSVDYAAAAAFESLSTEERETNLVDRIAFKSLGVLVSNPFMPSLKLS
jgi:hypothetical protein